MRAFRDDIGTDRSIFTKAKRITYGEKAEHKHSDYERWRFSDHLKQLAEELTKLKNDARKHDVGTLKITLELMNGFKDHSLSLTRFSPEIVLAPAAIPPPSPWITSATMSCINRISGRSRYLYSKATHTSDEYPCVW